jgi:two-component system nitrogen regulation sensor histidine kinase NtrY
MTAQTGKDSGVTDRQQPNFGKRLLREDNLAYLIILFTLVMGVATAYSISHIGSLDDNADILTVLLVIDLVAVIVLGTLVVRQIWRIWSERRQRLAGHQLHWRLALLFGGVTTLPAIIITLFALFVVDYSLRGWFADRISTAVTGSVQVADAYFEEHSSSISSDVLTIANDVNREAFRLANDPAQMNVYLNNQAALRNLSEAIIFDGTGQVLAKSRFAFAVTFTSLRTDWIDQARSGEVVVLRSDDTNKLRALVKLTSYVDAYLFVGRFIDNSVLEAVDTTRLAASDYQQIGLRQLDLQVSFAFLFGLVLLLLLIAALWIGLNLANAIVVPLGSVISVAEQVRSGNLSERVPENLEVEEIAELGSSFNRMLDELNRSREQLVQANTQLDRRREFTEAVLGGVSSGVIGLDNNGKVTLPNATAKSLLGLTDANMIGKRLDNIVPEFKPLLTVVGKKLRRLSEEQIVLSRGQSRLTLRARIASEIVDGRVIGYVVTFDDVTDLLNAQRKAAWSDIARRIAHEIKNPLTPIQLASDRLRKKYKPDDEKAAEQFGEYLSIISRQVGDIGRMVDEFSAFARMPQPVMQPVSVRDLATGQLSLFEADGLSCEMEIDGTDSDDEFIVYGDPGLLRQALTNLIQNASDSLLDDKTKNPKIILSLGINDGSVTIKITDNGPGFPDMDLGQLLEPYVTKREKGTGLGLAIVSKVIQDHAGSLELANVPEGGACVTVRIPMFEVQDGTEDGIKS